MPTASPLNPLVTARHETAPLTTDTEARTDGLELLDHRSRARAIHRDQAPAGHYLELSDALGDAYVLPIDRSVVHIGRAIAADLRFEEARVSRRHAILVRHGSNARVLDDRSSTGTFVNGRRIVSSDLHAGDVVRIGPIVMTYTVIR